MNTKLLTPLFFGALFAAPSAMARPGGTVDICHETGSASNPVVRITVSSNAAAAHLRHGDTMPFDVYADQDGDGLGDSGAVLSNQCSVPEGYAVDDGDCDDSDASRGEVCDVEDTGAVCGDLIGEDLRTVPVWDGECDASRGFVKHGANCYYFDDTPTMFQEARATCMAAGGYLATVRDQAENDFLSDFGARIYLGGCRVGEGDDFAWVTGESFDYTNWAAGTPDDFYSEDALEMLPNGLWNDIWTWRFGWNEGFVCEFDD